MAENRCAVHGLLEPCLGCAANRLAVRDGVTPQEVHERVRRGDEIAGDGVRTCALAGCNGTFVPRNAQHRFCSTAHRVAAHRARTGGGS